MQIIYDKCKGISEKLLRCCRNAKATKYEQTAWEEIAMLHLVFINGLNSVEVSESMKPDPTIQERQKMAFEKFKEALKNFPHSPLHDKAEEIEKKLQETFYQPVSVQEMKDIMKAMEKDVGSGIGSYGGHWYQCPNGHVYTIGECGGAMQTSRCPDCGATIGGSNHRLNNNNRPATEFLRAVNAPTPPDTWREDTERDEQLARQFVH